MTTAAVSTRFGDTIGAANVATDPAQLVAYQIDGKTPTTAVRPGSAKEVVEIVRCAAAEKLAVVPCGARTKLSIGMPPRKYDIALDTTRLDRVIAYDPGDLTLGVEPGVALQKLSSVLAEHGQFLPLSVPFMERATMGGTTASGVDTPLRQFYGTPRDYVLGMEFVTGEGEISKSGGSVVKNVTGYDMHKLMIGALGTLGVMTRINFRTFPLPQATRTYLATFRWANAACEFRHSIARSPLRPLSIEIIAAGDTVMLRADERPSELFEKRRWSALVSIAGKEDVLARSRRELESFARTADRDSLESFSELGGGDQERLNSYIREFPALATRSSFPAAIFKISVLPKNLVGLTEGIHSVTMRHDVPWAVMMRGVGVAYLALMAPDRGAESLQRLKEACVSVFRSCAERGWGRGVLVSCPMEFKQEINVWGAVSDDFALMQGLKKVFDPHGIFAPGRFVGGI